MDNVIIKIEKLQKEVEKIDNQITENDTKKKNLQIDNISHSNAEKGISYRLYSLSDQKEYVKGFKKRLIGKMFGIMGWTFLTLICIWLGVAILIWGTQHQLLGFILYLCVSMLCGINEFRGIKKYISIKKEQKEYNLENIEKEIGELTKSLELNKKWQDENEYKNEERISQLNDENEKLEINKQVLLNRINQLQNLRNGVIEEFIKDNFELDSRINSKYEEQINEEGYQKSLKLNPSQNSDK